MSIWRTCLPPSASIRCQVESRLPRADAAALVLILVPELYEPCASGLQHYGRFVEDESYGLLFFSKSGGAADNKIARWHFRPSLHVCQKRVRERPGARLTRH